MKSFLLLVIFSFSLAFAVEEKKVHIPTREIAVIVTKEGYYPKSLSVFEGEKVKFYVTSTLEEPQCFIVESHKVFLAANKGKITEAEVVFDKAGEFSFYCPSSKNDGKVVVLKKSVPKREIASEKKKASDEAMLWTPREY